MIIFFPFPLPIKSSFFILEIIVFFFKELFLYYLHQKRHEILLKELPLNWSLKHLEEKNVKKVCDFKI